MDTARYVALHQQWIAGQQAGLGELAEAAANAAAGRATDAELRAVVERCMRGYQEYAASRRAMARENGAAFVAPPWCTAFENSVLWLGGCRPSLAIRLLYSISGEGLEEDIEEFVSGRGRGLAEEMGLIGITATQLQQINDLHRWTLRDEGYLTERLASLQENIADRPLLPIVRERAAAAAALAGQDRSANRDAIPVRPVAAESSGGVAAEVDAAMESYSAGLARLLEEADELRMSTARAAGAGHGDPDAAASGGDAGGGQAAAPGGARLEPPEGGRPERASAARSRSDDRLLRLKPMTGSPFLN